MANEGLENGLADNLKRDGLEDDVFFIFRLEWPKFSG